MKLKKYPGKACCGKTMMVYVIEGHLSTNTIASLIGIGFKEQVHFTKTGILYVENADFIITGPIGSNRLNINCKRSECTNALISLEAALLKME